MEREFGFGVARQLFEPVLVSSGEHLFAEGDDGADPSFASMHWLYWLTVNLTALMVNDACPLEGFEAGPLRRHRRRGRDLEHHLRRL